MGISDSKPATNKNNDNGLAFPFDNNNSGNQRNTGNANNDEATNVNFDYSPESPVGSPSGWDVDTIQNFDQTPPSPTNAPAILDVQTQDFTQQENIQVDETSPFISPQMYNDIMRDSQASSDSPFISQNEYDRLMKGGHQLESSSMGSVQSISISSGSASSSPVSDLLSTAKPKHLVPASSPISSLISNSPVSDPMYPYKSESISSMSSTPVNRFSSPSTENVEENVDSASGSEYNIKMYGFSDTSSEVIKTSENNYIAPNSSDTPYQVGSSSVATEDIQLVSVGNSASEEIGQRYLD